MFYKILKVIRNKYFIAFTSFLIWILFFDNYNLIKQYEYRRELKEVTQQKEFYLSDIAKDQKSLHELMTNDETLEKFAREKYLMKRDNEDVYVVMVQDSSGAIKDPRQ
jgi:cell division protein FtsB